MKIENGCALCGEKDDRCLVFHHRDPATKLYTIREAIATRTRAVVMAEIAKCDIVCLNCHAKVHARISSEILIQTSSPPRGAAA